MSSSPLQGLILRAGVCRSKDIGYLYAGDPIQERKEIPHTYTFRWRSGEFTRGECNYDVISGCLLSQPEFGILYISEIGSYSFNTASGMKTGHIIEDSSPRAEDDRMRGFRSVSSICGTGYAVGYRGMVYRYDNVGLWTRVDLGLSSDFRIEDIDGFSPTDIFVVGLNGKLWHGDGTEWEELDSSTNLNLNVVKCVDDGSVYVGGAQGILLHGRGSAWKVIDHQRTGEDIWDIEWFRGKLYVSTLSELFVLEGDLLEKVDFSFDRPATFYKLSVGDGAMWSVGESDVSCFDGSTWFRVV